MGPSRAEGQETEPTPRRKFDKIELSAIENGWLLETIASASRGHVYTKLYVPTLEDAFKHLVRQERSE